MTKPEKPRGLNLAEKKKDCGHNGLKMARKARNILWDNDVQDIEVVGYVFQGKFYTRNMIQSRDPWLKDVRNL